MASGTITFSASGYLQGKIDWSSSSNGSVANSSKVTAKLYAKRTNSYTTKGQSWSGYVKVGSTQTNISFSSSVSVSSSWVHMATVTATVSHNDDGTKSVTISGSVTGPSGTSLSGNTSSGSKSVTLDTIPRASSLGTISNFTLGNSINIPITKRSSSFTDTLTISVGGSTVKTISSITNGYDVSFSTSELNTIYSKLSGSKSGTFTFKLTTKSGSTTIGTSSKTATGTVPNGTLGTISNFTLGNNISIPISKYYSGLTYNLTISLSSTTIKTVNGVTNGTTVSFSSSELTTIYGKLPSATSGTFTFTITTKCGSATVGTSSKTATGTIPSSIKPSISSVTITEAGGVPSSWGVYVKNKTKLKFVTKASAGTGSSVSSIKTTINKVTYTGATITTNAINVSGKITATITVTDKRNRSVSTTKSVTIIDYGNPYITSIKAVRCDADGNTTDKGTYVKVTLVGGIYSVNGKNTPSYTIQYKKTNTSSYTTYKFSDTTATINKSVILSNFESASSYNVRAIVEDYFTDTNKSASTVPSVYRTLSFLAGGHGVAIGKLAEFANIFDVGFATTFLGRYLYMGGNKLSDDEKNIYFNNTQQGTYPHGSKIYGGSSTSAVALGVWDTNIADYVWRYKDDDPTFDIGSPSVPVNVTKTLKIPKNGAAGAGITNADGISILRDHGNNNVTLGATGGTLYIGYQNTTGLNFMNGKASMNSSGDITIPALKIKNSTYNDANVVYGSRTTNYFGTGGDFTGITNCLRGNTVRIYAHTSGAVYLGNSGSTAITSDENLKNILEINDKYIEFFNKLKPISYIYKNNGHRSHIGFGARQVEQALQNAGLTTEEFAGVLKDTDVTISSDEMGTEEDVHFDELYSLRYEEFIALNTLMIQKQSEEIKFLKEEIKNLKTI